MSSVENHSEKPFFQELREKLKDEIAPVCWHDLQIVYARGITIVVSGELDLLEVAFEVSTDNTQQVNQWMTEGKLTLVKDEQALEWFNHKTELLTAIVKPWVLIQEYQP